MKGFNENKMEDVMMTTDQSDAIDIFLRSVERKQLEKRAVAIADAFVSVYFARRWGGNLCAWLSAHRQTEGNGPAAREKRAEAWEEYHAVRRLAREMAERGIIDMVTVNNWTQQ